MRHHAGRDARQVFLSYLQARNSYEMTICARASLRPPQMFTAIRREVGRLDASLPVYGMKTMEGNWTNPCGSAEALRRTRLVLALAGAGRIDCNQDRPKKSVIAPATSSLFSIGSMCVSRSKSWIRAPGIKPAVSSEAPRSNN